jgi:putative spermidine/putrescine transport system permease protein
MTAIALEGAPRRLRLRVSDALYRRRRLLILLLLVPPLLWVGAVYVGSLAALLVNSLFRLDHFTGQVVREVDLGNFVALVEGANVDVVLRAVTMALLVTAACIVLALPIAWYMARYASGAKKAALYLAVMLPLWSSYLVRLYAWKLLLAKEGAISWGLAELHLGWVLEGLLAAPVIGGHSLSFSPLGTFIVFVYLWLPFMILPIQAALERVPASLVEASGDLGAHPATTFWRVVFPLTVPGIAAGSIFTFSLTLGDYIVPGVIGDSSMFIGQVVSLQQGTAGNVPLAAALSLVPIAVIALFLWAAKRLGAFDAL